MDYRESLENLIATLTQSNCIEVISSVINSPASKWVFEDFKDEGIEISKEIFDFYAQMDGCEIEWVCDLQKYSSIRKFHDDDESVTGKIHIVNLFRLLTYDRKIYDFYENQFSIDEIDDLKKFRQFTVNDSYTKIGFLRENNLIGSSLYFVTEDADGFSPVPYSFEEYFERATYNLGIQSWEFHSLFENEEFDKYVEHYKTKLH